MKTVPVSKLKASLSRYLELVKAGEEVVVTDRGKRVARIVPLESAREAIPARMAAMERAGLIRIGTGKLPKGFWELPRPADPEGGCLAALLEERRKDR